MISFRKSTSIIPNITLSFIFLFICYFEDVLASPPTTRHHILCRPEQRDALLAFKNEFHIGKFHRNNLYCNGVGHRKTESWGNNSDCCSWKGITCDAKSGDVIELDLSRSGLQGQFHSNSSLQNLPFLTTLDLSCNQFSGQIPTSIGNLSNLINLTLSYNDFSGRIPSSIGNLFHLTSLNLSYNHFSGQIPSWIGNLTQLTDLSFSFNQISGEIPCSIGKLSQLTYLVLWGNNLVGEIPSSVGNLNQLTNLDVRGNLLSGNFPNVLLNLTGLSELYISNNQFSGALPQNITSLSNLRYFVAISNAFTGTIPSSLFTIPSLICIGLSDNQLNGTLEFGNITSSSNLQCLLLNSNRFKGKIPRSISKLVNLWYLSLSHFDTQGRPIDFSIFSPLKSLEVLHLSYLNTTSTIDLYDILSHFKSLSQLDLSGNHVSITNKNSVSVPSLSGSIPRCMVNLKRNLSVLNVRHNNLSGGLPEDIIFESLRSLDVGHNQLVGKLPRSLNRFSTLQVLNVESNRINDTFPFWLGSLQKLQVLVLRSNAFHGPIHQASFPQLRIIDISDNHFGGTLPSEYFMKWTAISSLGKNDGRSDEMYMGSIYYQDSMVLMNKGVELELVRILTIYTAIDFSGNIFEGEIPRSIGLLKELRVLNLSNNAFTGNIPSSMGNLAALESLDISQNKLSGEIPQELGNLSFLAYMNFSHNRLSGLLPGGNQFRTQPCSSFGDNLGLFGSSLEKVCGDIHTSPSHQQYETGEPEEEDKEEVISWIAAGIGFIPGIFFGFMIGYIFLSNKPKWFMNPFGRNNRRRRSTTTH